MLSYSHFVKGYLSLDLFLMGNCYLQFNSSANEKIMLFVLYA